MLSVPLKHLPFRGALPAHELQVALQHAQAVVLQLVVYLPQSLHLHSQQLGLFYPQLQLGLALQHLLLTLQCFLAVSRDALVVLLALLVEGSLDLGVNGRVLLHELVDLVHPYLVLDVLQHHLVVAQLEDEFSVELLELFVLIVEAAELLAAC